MTNTQESTILIATIRDEQATCWNHRLVKGLPVLPMSRLKGPDASKRTSRSWSLTQSSITTCHSGHRHRRRVDDSGTCEGKIDENDGGQKDNTSTSPAESGESLT